MSRNSPSTASKSTPQPRRADDLRVRRTRDRLGTALITLMQEKPIDEISVQEVLDRARVGRSTFYVHFRDTDDLLMTQLEHFLDMMSTSLSRQQEQSERVAPVAEMFAHIGGQQKMWRALAGAGRLPDFFDLFQGYFARGIEQRLHELKRNSHLSKTEMTARSHALAGSLLSLLRWWIDRGAKQSAKSMDVMFHRMVWGEQTSKDRRSS